MIETIVPILRVEDIEASKAYYLNALGFRLDWGDAHMISVSRDGCALMLCQGAQGSKGVWVWIGCQDVDALHAAFRAGGAHVRDAPQNFPWAYEMQIEDPDGHVLRFGCETKPGVEFGVFKL